MEDRFSLFIIDGDAVDVNDPYTSVLSFRGLRQDDTDRLIRLSIDEGYAVVVCKDGEDEIKEGGGACGEA